MVERYLAEDSSMLSRHRSRLPSFLLGLMTALTACGTSTQDLGRDAPGTPPPGSSSQPTPPPPAEELPSDGSVASTWEWLNPAPQANRIRGMGGSADDDVWLVGDGNTVLHWNGERWSDRHGALRGLDLYSVWSSGPDDVWVAGDHGVSYRYESSLYSTHLNPGGGVVLHFDGSAWKPDPQIGNRSAHAIWGADANHVFALLENGDVGQFDGTSWTITASPAGAVLRDIWGASPTDVWAVGERGAIVHFDGTRWTTVARGSGDPYSDPTAQTNTFYGIWGGSADDVWAVFDDLVTDDPAQCCEHMSGLVHWDGASWKVAQTLFLPDGELEKYPFKRDPSAPLRLGHQLWGGSGGRVLSLVYGTTYVLSFDEKTWRYETAFHRGIRTLWGRPGLGSLFAAGEGGVLQRFDGGASAANRVSDVFHGFRQSLQSIVAAGDDLWGIALRQVSLLPFYDGDLGEVVRWTTGGWAHVRLNVVDPKGASCPVSVGAIVAAGTDDVWVSGAHLTSCSEDSSEMTPDVFHWDGATWTAMPLPEELNRPFPRAGASSVEVRMPNGGKAPWLVSKWPRTNVLHRWNGAAWTEVRLPAGLLAEGVGGSSDEDIWAVGRSRSEGREATAVLHLEGSAFVEVHRETGAYLSARIQATSPNDVWIQARSDDRSSPTRTFHWDGKDWSMLRDLKATAVWPMGDGTAYFLSNDDQSGDEIFELADSRYVLGHWNGTKKTILGETSAVVRSLAATKDALWIGGEWGSTLRFPLSMSPR